MTNSSADSALTTLSDGLADAVARAGESVVLVDARSRFPATGVVWGNGGVIVTAHHVVERDDDISVLLPDGSQAPAVLVGREPGTDLAVLRTDAAIAPARRAGPPRVGQLALAIGRPEPSIMASFGVVSALGGPWRSATGVAVDGYIRADVTFLPGFSGGPLVDVEGAVLGINSSRLGNGGGLAIPASTVEQVVSALVEHGHVRRGYLGITTQPVTSAAANGLLVVGVEPGSPAETGGLLVGDIVVGVGDAGVNAGDDLRVHLGGETIGRPVAIRIVRGGRAESVRVTIGERTRERRR